MSTRVRDDAELRTLVQRAERAMASGQRDEAARLLSEATAAAPDHPLVLNAAGVQELHRGRFESARNLVEKAIATDSGNAAFWINLASALRGLNLRDEEMRALERALAIEPRHLLALLQKASLLELTGKMRAAARTYHNALQSIPAGTALPQSLRTPIERAVKAVRDNNATLEAFLGERSRDIEMRHSGIDRSRFHHGLDALLGKRRIFTSQPTFLHLPKLPAEEFYARRDFPWLDEVEAASAAIRSEFERVFAEDADRLEPYIAYPEGVPIDQWKELNHSRRWSVFYLWRDGKPLAEHLARCPITASLIEKTPKVDIPSVGPTAFFSVLDAHSHIPAHTGVTNTRLVVHLPLIVPPGCRFRVGSETRQWRPGEAWVFDDTIEHEAWNDSDAPRAVLIFDIWNPYLNEAERDLVRATVSGIREYYGEDSPLAESH